MWNRKREKRKKEIRERKKKSIKRLTEDRIFRDIRILFEQEEDYYKPKRVTNFWDNLCIEYESNGDRNRNLPLDEYFNKIEPSLRNIITDLQNSDTWKIKLTIVNNSIFTKDAEEEHAMHWRSSNITFTSYNDGNNIADKFFESLQSRYQGNLARSMTGGDFISDSVQIMYYKCRKLLLRCGCLDIDSPDWIK